MSESLQISHLLTTKRNQFRSEIRKEKNQFCLNQKRLFSMNSNPMMIHNDINNGPPNSQFLLNSESISQRLKTFAFNINHSQSFTDTNNNLYLVRCFLMDIFLNNSKPSFSEIIDSEIPQILLNFLKNHYGNDLINRIEAARSLLILTAGPDCNDEKLATMNIGQIAMEYFDEKVESNEMSEVIMTLLANLSLCEANKKKMLFSKTP